MNKIVVLIAMLLLFSCKKEIKQHAVKVYDKIEKDTLITQAIPLLNASKKISNWIELSDFENELTSVSNTSIRSEKQLEQLINLLTKIKETTPDKFKTNSINARIKVMETELLMYNQYVKEQDLKNSKIRKLRLQKTYNVLVNQISAQLTKEKDYQKYK